MFPFTLESVFSLIPFKAQPIPPDIAMQAIPRIDSGIPFVNNAVSNVLPAATSTSSVNPLQIWTAVGAYVYEMSDRMFYDYALSIIDGRLVVTQSKYNGSDLATGNLTIINGELTAFGIDRTIPELEPKETTPPTSSPTPISIDNAISSAIIANNQNKYGGDGDFAAASAVTLKTVEHDGLITAYIMAYYAEYSNNMTE